MDIVRWEKLMPFSTWSSPWIISKAFSYGNVDSEVFTQQKSKRIKSASLLGHRIHVLCTVISLAIVCPCPHSTAPCLVPHCFRMTPLLLQLVGTLCVSWVNGLSEQNYFLKFQLHFKYLLRLWAKSWCFEKSHSDNCTNSFSHTHLIKVNEKCATKISIHGTMFSPTMCLSFQFILSQWRGGDL